MEINYLLLGTAVTFYKTLGYVYVETPWRVPNNIAALTCQDTNKFETTSTGLVLVGSAEQGFLHMAQGGSIPSNTPLVSCGPCFRINEPDTPYHFDHFMKVELGYLCENNNPELILEQLTTDATEFMQYYSHHPVERVETPEGFDLTIQGVEVGSYGYRPDFEWVYATGLALPRFNQVNA